MQRPRFRFLAILFVLVFGAAPALEAQEPIPSPEEQFGFQMGADYHLANYQELMVYWEILAERSDRMVLDTIGTTAEGRPQLMGIVTSPENHGNLERYKEISRRLTWARGVPESEARRLSEEGKPIVWIDGGLHATEVLGAQQLVEMVYRLVTRDDEETTRILDDVVVLAVHANPDGHDLVADWYMRRDEPEARSSAHVPVLYQKYAGHDNNRDFYMANLSETTNMNRVAYREWFPQIMYNHHQTGPTGTIMFAPPFRGPPNHNLDPMILTSLLQVGSAMHHRFVREGKGGTTMLSGASYSTWWNGGLRTTPYFHNMIGLLTETRGHPNPIQIPFVPDRQITHNDLPLPVEPTETWHFRQSVEYSQTANWAVLDYASRNGDILLFNAWRMSTNSIERGSRDSWTVIPDEIERAGEVLGSQDARATVDEYEEFLKAPADRDPRGYILPSDQPDFNTAAKFMNALLKNGVEVLRATSDFEVAGERYPEGSFVVKTDQAFRPHILDMFEPQNHPDDFAYPGGPPIAPYDNAGWTLAYQMDVEVDRIRDGFDGPFEPVDWLAEPDAGSVSGPADAAGWLLDHRVNDAFVAVNRLLDEGHDVRWLREPAPAAPELGAGAFYIPAGDGVRQTLDDVAREVGLDFRGVASAPGEDALGLRAPRIGLWDEYGGSMASGWTRFVLESFGFSYELVFAKELDAGNLRAKFDVLIFPDGAIPMTDNGGRRFFGMPDAEDVPERWRDRLGEVTVENTVPRILEFLRTGGTVITVGSSTSLGYHAELPIRNWLVNDAGEPLDSDVYYVPGSVLDLKLEHTSPVTHGLGERANVLFSRSPVFGLEPGALRRGVKRIGWFDHDEPLRSGWAWGQERLKNGTTMLEARVGDGRLFLFGPKITFRGQSHGTFPLLFNAIHYGAAEGSSGT